MRNSHDVANGGTPSHHGGPGTDVAFAELLAGSHERVVGTRILPEGLAGAEAARWLYGEAPFGLLAHDTSADPLFMYAPVWMRIVTGLSAFVYMLFYLVLVPALIRGWNWIQLPAVIYATMIASITGIIVFGVEFFGEPEWQTGNPVKFLAFNLPYVLIPLLLLIRMRKPLPFTRKF